ncbi:MAG: hypothetical protein IJH86_05945 [Clostridia bacterium]|nr:hypothetical protein [Clostridia bacterium]
MKRAFALLLCLILFPAAALADDMVVVNCNEWVSLRKGPSASSERLMKVPLYEIVTDCQWAENDFVRCTYGGMTGYVQGKYLEPLEPNEPETLLDVQLPQYGMEVMALRQYDGATEKLTVTGYDASGAEKWRYVTDGGEPTELSMTDAFIGGTSDDPRVLVFNAKEGLYSLNLYTGEVIWLLADSEVNLGAGIAHAADGDGTLYVCGYYGPDPVCIGHDGQVRWQSDSGSDDIFWPYRITVEERGIVTQYAMTDRDEGEGRVIYDRDDGHVVDIEYDR